MIDVKIDNIFVVLNQIERLGNGIENRYLLNRKVRIPQREFLTLTDDDKQALMDDVQDYFSGLIP